MTSERDVLDALQQLRRDADAVVASAHVASIRLAMHGELGRQRRTGFADRFRAALTASRVAYSGIGVALAVGALLAAGWSSPAGSALHEVQLAREWVQRSLPGADQSALLLGWAESDLRNARAGVNRQAAIAEATTLLDECRDYLAASPATLDRWQRDESALVALAGSTAPGGSGVPTHQGGGSPSTAAPGQAPGTSGGSPGGAGAPSSSSGGGDSETPSPTAGSHDDSSSPGGSTSSPGGPSSTMTPSPAPSGGGGSPGGPGTSGGGSDGGSGGSSGGPGPSPGGGSGSGSEH